MLVWRVRLYDEFVSMKTFSENQAAQNLDRSHDISIRMQLLHDVNLDTKNFRKVRNTKHVAPR